MIRKSKQLSSGKTKKQVSSSSRGDSSRSDDSSRGDSSQSKRSRGDKSQSKRSRSDDSIRSKSSRGDSSQSKRSRSDDSSRSKSIRGDSSQSKRSRGDDSSRSDSSRSDSSRGDTDKMKRKKKIGKSHIDIKKGKKLSPEDELLHHQKLVVNFMLTHHGVLVDHGLGSGKTRIPVILVSILKQPAVVVLPASLQDNFWKEVDKTKTDRSLFHVISFQSFLRQNIDCTGKILIIDEAHLLRNDEGKISQKVSIHAQHASKVLLLTGTPLVNRPSDIAPLLNLIVKNKINIPIKTGWFTTTTFTEIPTGDNFDEMFGEDGLNSTGYRLWNVLFPSVLSMYNPPKSDDYPSSVTENVLIPMTSQQMKIYSAWETKSLTPKMVKMLSSKKTQESIDITQLPNFRAYLDGGRRICNVVEMDGKIFAPKFEAMLKHIQSTSGKAVVFSQYLEKGIDIAAKMFTDNGISFVTFTGRESQSAKHDAVEKYNTDKVRVFLLSAAGGMGLDLKETESVHIMDTAWNEATNQQAIFRAVRFKSHKDPNAVVHIYRYYCYKSKSIFFDWITRFFSNTPSADVYLMNLSKKKEQINQRFLNVAKQFSIEEQADKIQS